ncbi:MAG: phosphoribosylformylglycinamidine synthase subunit PurS [Nitrospinae bacterium]|nr:phosphoribosylformylglycinamidine synthase subunit PurS [Nitrospinota bacterium]
MKAKVTVTLRDGILDTQGKAVEHALHSLGFTGVKNVRIGKHIEMDIDGADAATAKKQVDEMCGKLLSNPVMENFQITVTEGK